MPAQSQIGRRLDFVRASAREYGPLWPIFGEIQGDRRALRAVGGMRRPERRLAPIGRAPEESPLTCVHFPTSVIKLLRKNLINLGSISGQNGTKDAASCRDAVTRKRKCPPGGSMRGPAGANNKHALE
jgi:hypothetical protein